MSESNKCANCPVSGKCHGVDTLPHLCEWAASGNEQQIQAVIRRAALPAPVFVLPPEPPGPECLSIHTYLSSHSGYGQIAEWLGRGLEQHGAKVRYKPIHSDERFVPLHGFVRDRIDEDVTDWVLQIAVPWTEPIEGKKTVTFTMWESSRIDQRSVDALNKAECVVVPNVWNAEGFRASGVTVPIRVVPFGIDAGEGYTPKPYTHDKPFTFGMAARMAHGGVRKGVNEGMLAFVDAFPNGEDVRLEVKVFDDCLPFLRTPDDPRITIIIDPLTPKQMSEWYGGIDVLFVPSKGEGWGLHTNQAMACGRPVIAANYGGTREFWTPECGWELDYVEKPAGEFYTGMGMWCVPTHESMVESLREAFADPEACKRKGEVAAKRAAEFTWSLTGRELAAAMHQVGALPKPEQPRVRVGFWCPVLQVGGAEAWTRSLIRSLDPSKIEVTGLAVTLGEEAAMDEAIAMFKDVACVTYGTEAGRELAQRSDVIVSWTFDGVAALVDGLNPKPKILSVCHAPKCEHGDKLYQGDNAKGIDHYAAVSELALDPIPPQHRKTAKVIWNAVDQDRLKVTRSREQMRERWGVPQSSRVVAYVGRLSEEKDPFACVRLAANLPDPWHVVVVGSGWQKANLEALIEATGVKNCHLVGPDSAVGDILNAADWCFVPSRFESFGLTIAEALTIGCPLVSTNVGIIKLTSGLAKTVPDNAPGSLLARSFLEDDQNSHGRLARVQRGKAFAQERLSEERFGLEWSQYLLDVGGRQTTPVLTGVKRQHALLQIADACPNVSTEGCGCGGKRRCSLNRGRNNSQWVYRQDDCVKCETWTLPEASRQGVI